MTKSKLWILAAIALCGTSLDVNAQDETVQVYFELNQLPKLIEIMPAPPAFESPEFANDIVRYCWGKQQRLNEARVAQAIADAEWEDHTKLYALWKDAFGLEITENDTPEIWKLMETSLATTDPMRKETKAFYHRQRPFERFNEAMPSHEEDELRGEGSYPSGHSMRGWSISLLLAQIAPSRAKEIYRRGWDYCDSRVIVGAHWQSDVDNSRTAASIGFCYLQGSEAFLTQMRKAQVEYNEKIGQIDASSAIIIEHPASHAHTDNSQSATGDTNRVIER